MKAMFTGLWQFFTDSKYWGKFFFWHVFAFFSMCCEVLDLDKFAVDNFKFLLKNLICDRLGKL